MLIVQVCVGSACSINGSKDIVEMFKSAIEKHNLDGEVVLVGSFCLGKCNRTGVTVQINDDIHIGVTKENFNEFFNKKILEVIENERK